MYGEFGDEWQAIFKAKPYQGQDPEKAKVLFVGRDANYPDDLCNDPFFERVKEYHRDGVTFWGKYEVHHPFLCKDFPFPRNAGGYRYHYRFTRLGLKSEDAQYISFIELRELPTRGVTGKIPKSVFISKLEPSHMQRLDRWIMQSGRKLVFLPKTVRDDMLKFRKGDTNLFQFLNFNPPQPLNAFGLAVIYADNDIVVLETYSFASTEIYGITSKMKTVIDRFLQGHNIPLLTTRKSDTPKGEKKMVKGDFDIFCKRVKDIKGWFPRGQTSVMLRDYDLNAGVCKCQIKRPADTGADPRLFTLRRSEINLSIRACRAQGRLINTGELRRAGIRGWAVAPLYGLLKLYFDQIGFSK